MTQETFQLPFTIHGADTTRGTFTGFASVFGVLIDTYPPTIIERGAFAKTLRENRDRVKILWQHFRDTPIGKPLRLTETAEGLEIVGRISATAQGKDAMTLLRDGVVDELSIGFDAIKWSMDHPTRASDEPLRRITELRLWEVSLVTWGANPAAKIVSVHRARRGLRADVQRKMAELDAAFGALDDPRMRQVDALLQRLPW
jgi:HK97 family phage prohead protease